MTSKIILSAALLALGLPFAAGAQRPGGATGPGQVAPDSRAFRAADESMNHPRTNHRVRHCTYRHDARGVRMRHCTWK